jgi:di/tricarboxylate transporter
MKEFFETIRLAAKLFSLFDNATVNILLTLVFLRSFFQYKSKR